MLIDRAGIFRILRFLGAILMFFDIFLDFYLFGVFSMRKCVRIWIFSMRKIPALLIDDDANLMTT
jgi:hypothetical protein